MKDAFVKMFPVANQFNEGWPYRKEYNFAQFTTAFEHMFSSFQWNEAVPDPSGDWTTGHPGTAQTTTEAENMKRVVAFLWAHAKHESGGLNYLKEAACQANHKDP